MTSDALEDRIRQIRLRLQGRLGDLVADLGTAFDATPDGGVPEGAFELYTRLHNVSGSAGPVGLPDIGDAARRLEEHLTPWLKNGPAHDGWREAFDGLRAAVDAGSR
ncbi:Hpt domain-containing protein [Caulobacter sp. NIBR2454]|uniref:Hpt domain-containing protein n=1 Tax=Caulobacter sp. NIBR2454 TaxID=3015996 RepID=UPI0022B66F69|nr:Hpt domain-containing protein [Caulobacter sp. NIBR2454]